MESIREQIQLFTRRFGLLNASCCDECCGEDISMAQSHILSEIRRAGSPAMQEVAEELGMDITTFSRQVKNLEAKGLVCRRVSPDDRRVSLLGLTGAGLQVLGKIDGYMAARLERVFSRMSAFECEIVIRSLSLLNESLVGTAEGTSDQEGAVACCK
ncbi:MAG: MarR family transcriptional regulator [Desulfuromonadaceae bacterium]